MDFLANTANGDARAALNALELAVLTTEPQADKTIHITLEEAQECIQKRALNYDKDGDNHYDTISAFIKSMRGSDPDAALYYLAKMIYAGEDPKFIARRVAHSVHRRMWAMQIRTRCRWRFLPCRRSILSGCRRGGFPWRRR